MAARPAPRQAAVLVIAAFIAFLFFLQLDLDIAYEDAAGDMRVQAVGLGRHLREHLFGNAGVEQDDADDESSGLDGLLPETEIVLHAPGASASPVSAQFEPSADPLPPSLLVFDLQVGPSSRTSTSSTRRSTSSRPMRAQSRR